MAHPTMFDDADLVLGRLRRVCLALPGAKERVSHGRPHFFTTRVFAAYGGVVKGDHHSGMYDSSVLVLPDPGERPALLSDPRFFEPAYYGPSGWVGLNFRAAVVDWAEVAELIEDSYLNTAPALLCRHLREHAGQRGADE